jgi:1,2-diacylglycerol 3-alpha-glucosyltransferase
MKILITTDAYMPMINGVVTSVINLYMELKGKGHDVRILTLSSSGKSEIAGDVYYVKSNGIKIYPDARFTVAFWDKVIGEIIEWRPEIIHSQSEFSTFFIAKKIAGKLHIPLVHTYHTMYEQYTHYFAPNKAVGKKMVTVFTKELLKGVSSVIAPTAKVKKSLIGYGVTAPIAVVPTGLLLERFQVRISEEEKSKLKRSLRIEEKTHVLVSIGRLGKEKNFEELFSNIRELLKKREDVCLLLVGDGPDRKELEQLAADMELEQKIYFVGKVLPEEVYQYYQLGEIFVSCSTSETQGLTFIEAMASGLPLVCKADDCLENVLYDGMNGYVIQNQKEFTDGINSLLENKELYKQMAAEAELVVRDYSVEKFADKIEDIYEEEIFRNCLKESAASLSLRFMLAKVKGHLFFT